MDFNEYQKEAKKTAVYPEFTYTHWNTPIKYNSAAIYNLFQLAAEVGELQSKLAKEIRKDEIIYTPDELALELGDILWSLAMLADAWGYDLEDIASMNLSKLHSRMERNVICGDGDNR